MSNNTSIRLISSESLVFAGAGSKTPDGPSPSPRTTYLLFLSNTGDPESSTSILYLIPSGAADTSSALQVRPGEAAQFGPFRVDNLVDDTPDVYSSGAVTALLTWVAIVSEK